MIKKTITIILLIFTINFGFSAISNTGNYKEIISEDKDYKNQIKEIEKFDEIYCPAVYDPVCAEINVQCVKAPCPPIRKTFSNSCEAGKNKLTKVLYKGECEKISDDKIKNFTIPTNKTYKNITKHIKPINIDISEKFIADFQFNEKTGIYTYKIINTINNKTLSKGKINLKNNEIITPINPPIKIDEEIDNKTKPRGFWKKLKFWE